MRSLFRRISAREEGFTLVELVMAMMIFSIALAAMLTLFSGVERTAARQASRAEVNDQIRVAMDRLTKDLRQAETVRAGSSVSLLDMDTYINGVEHRVTYAISGTDLTRSVDGATAITMLERLQSTTLYAYSPDVSDPSVVTITLISRPERYSGDVVAVTLTSEVQLRNRKAAA